MAKIIERVYPKPLKNRREELLRYELDCLSPPEPILEVNQRYCVVNNNYKSIRNLFLIPWLLACYLSCYWHIDEFITEWNKSERNVVSDIIFAKKKYGDDFFQTTTNQRKINKYKMIDKNGQMSFDSYLEYRYNYFVGGQLDRMVDIALLIIYGLAIPILTYSVIRFRKQAPLYFDRQENLVYSWRKGQVWVQRYDDLRITEDIYAITFALRGDLKYGVIGWHKFLVQPTGNPLIHSISTYQPLLAFIVQFMQDGTRYLLFKDEPFHRSAGFFLFEDKQPENFEEKMMDVLRRADEANDEAPLDEHGEPIPIDLKALTKKKKEQMKKNKILMKKGLL